MSKVAGVRFRNAGKVYYFDPKDFTLRDGSHVIVETARGMEYGTVVGGMREIDEKQLTAPLRAIVRIANEEDEEKAEKNRAREREAMQICREKIRKHELDMKLIDAEYTFDNSKILFYFTADGRIDFRDLVKDLASVFRMRIELRQIGVRDETKILGGIGICGRPLCCSTWLSDFVPVSIKMAKEQNLSLNPAKISGVCGRLMCCLKNEEDTYEYLNSQLPAIGDDVTTLDGGHGVVSGVSVLRQKVKVLLDVGDEKEMREFDVAELSFRPRKRREKDRRDKKDKDGKEKRDRDQKTSRPQRQGDSRKAADTRQQEADTEGGTARADKAAGRPRTQETLDGEKPRSRRRHRRDRGQGEAESQSMGMTKDLPKEKHAETGEKP